MSEYDATKTALRELIAKLKTVKSAFEKFIDKELLITQGYRSQASDSHNALREYLRTENDRDKSFPPILKNADSDFIGGSYGRETKIWPLDDIDIYVPLDGFGLVYYNTYGVLWWPRLSRHIS
jgi:hypothetical protein